MVTEISAERQRVSSGGAGRERQDRQQEIRESRQDTDRKVGWGWEDDSRQGKPSRMRIRVREHRPPQEHGSRLQAKDGRNEKLCGIKWPQSSERLLPRVLYSPWHSKGP